MLHSPRTVAAALLLFILSYNDAAFASTITALPIQPRDYLDNPACSTANSLLTSCASATPGFLSLHPAEQGPCLCYTSSTIAPDHFDGPWHSCLIYLSTASPVLYTELAGTAGTSWFTTPCAYYSSELYPASDLPHEAACTSLRGIDEYCALQTPGFLALNFASQASCLCYVGTTWLPSRFDDYFTGCLSYVKTTDLSLYKASLATGTTTPCAGLGNIRTAITEMGTSTASAASPALTSSQITPSTPPEVTATVNGSPQSSIGLKLAAIVSLVLSLALL